MTDEIKKNAHSWNRADGRVDGVVDASPKQKFRSVSFRTHRNWISYLVPQLVTPSIVECTNLRTDRYSDAVSEPMQVLPPRLRARTGSVRQFCVVSRLRSTSTDNRRSAETSFTNLRCRTQVTPFSCTKTESRALRFDAAAASAVALSHKSRVRFDGLFCKFAAHFFPWRTSVSQNLRPMLLWIGDAGRHGYVTDSNLASNNSTHENAAVAPPPAMRAHPKSPRLHHPAAAWHSPLRALVKISSADNCTLRSCAGGALLSWNQIRPAVGATFPASFLRFRAQEILTRFSPTRATD